MDLKTKRFPPPLLLPQKQKLETFIIGYERTTLKERIINETLGTFVIDNNPPIFYMPDSIEWSFEVAQKYFPGNRLFINDDPPIVWGDLRGDRRTYYLQINRAISRGSNIDVIGLQSHMIYERGNPQLQDIMCNPALTYSTMDLYANFGRPLQISENYFAQERYTDRLIFNQRNIMKRIVPLLLLTLLLTGCTGTSSDANNTANAPNAVNTYRRISMAEAVTMMVEESGYIILDVRRADEFAVGHIPGAINVSNESIGTEEIPELPDRNQLIMVYCRSGRRSKEASEKLVKLGYTNIVEFGGILDWKGEIEK